eukprot:3139544-Pleurochrysis_carterae.AAC.1
MTLMHTHTHTRVKHEHERTRGCARVLATIKDVQTGRLKGRSARTRARTNRTHVSACAGTRARTHRRASREISAHASTPTVADVRQQLRSCRQ